MGCELRMPAFRPPILHGSEQCLQQQGKVAFHLNAPFGIAVSKLDFRIESQSGEGTSVRNQQARDGLGPFRQYFWAAPERKTNWWVADCRERSLQDPFFNGWEIGNWYIFLPGEWLELMFPARYGSGAPMTHYNLRDSRAARDPDIPPNRIITLPLDQHELPKLVLPRLNLTRGYH